MSTISTKRPSHEEDDSDLSDKEQAILDQLAKIRERKKRKKDESNELVDSDPEDIREEMRDTSYFKENVPKENEVKLVEKIKRETIFRKQKQQELGSFAARLQQAKLEAERTKVKHDLMINSRDYSFDIEDDFKPLDLKVDEKEKYSGRFINKRYINAELLDLLLKDKKLLRIDNLFDKVSPPDFKPPQYPNYVVFGIIVAKTSPKPTSDKKGKFVTITLSNFHLELKLNLFGKAFDRYWGMRIGDVIAVLNPSIWPFASDKGRTFSITLKNDGHSILEIGRARDLGFCKQITKAGQQCKQYYDTTRAEYCSFHMELMINKTASKRLELGGTSKMFVPTINGVKQAIIMNTNTDSSSNFSGRVVNDNSVPVINKQDEIARTHFSSKEAAKAFFDDKYHSPKFLNNIANEKLIHARKVKEKKLRKMLSEVPGAQILKSTDLETKRERLHRLQITKVAYDSAAMNKIGFNPTKRVFDSTYENENKDHTETKLALMMKKEREKSSKKLTPSEQDVKNKRALWKATYNEYHKNPKASSDSKGKEKHPIKPSSSSSSDSDEEIDFEDFGDAVNR